MCLLWQVFTETIVISHSNLQEEAEGEEIVGAKVNWSRQKAQKIKFLMLCSMVFICYLKQEGVAAGKKPAAKGRGRPAGQKKSALGLQPGQPAPDFSLQDEVCTVLDW